MLNTAGNRGFKWYSSWQQELLCCSRCGWVGTVGLDDLEDPTASGASIECPQCQKRIGEVLFPNLRDTEEAAAQGNEEAIRELPKCREQVAHAQARIDRFKQEKLENIDQLPELDGEMLEFTWDIAFAVLGAVAEFEREMLRERVKAGMAQARRAGRRVGRPALRQFAPSNIETMRHLRSQGTSVRKLATDFQTTQWMAARLTAKDAANGVSVTH